MRRRKAQLVEELGDRKLSRGFFTSPVADTSGDEPTRSAFDEQEPLSDAPTLTFADASQVLAAVSSHLQLLPGCRLEVSTVEEQEALARQVDALGGMLAELRSTISAATVVPPRPRDVLSIECLLEAAAGGLRNFRPGIALCEQSAGELDSLRIVRSLQKDTGRWAKRPFHLELCRWGDAPRATPDDFAEALFPPTGKPPDDEAAIWQRQAFHRIFQGDSSVFVNAAFCGLLLAFLDRGVEFQYAGQQVLDVGLSDGWFFEEPAPHGPEPPAQAGHSTQSGLGRSADSFAMFKGRDGGLVTVKSFGSLGIRHTWILLRLAREHEEEHEQPMAGADDQPPQVAVDLCSAGLGLFPKGATLEHPSHLVRSWSPMDDSRFICVQAFWGSCAWERLACGQSQHGKPFLHREALQAVLAATNLDSFGIELPAPASAIPADNADELEDQLKEVRTRLYTAMQHLGLLASVQSELEPALEDLRDHPMHTISVVHRCANTELARRLLLDTGFKQIAKLL